MIPPPNKPLATENANPSPTQIVEKRVSKYPVPPNHARNAVSVTRVERRRSAMWGRMLSGRVRRGRSRVPRRARDRQTGRA